MKTIPRHEALGGSALAGAYSCKYQKLSLKYHFQMELWQKIVIKHQFEMVKCEY